MVTAISETTTRSVDSFLGVKPPSSIPRSAMTSTTAGFTRSAGIELEAVDWSQTSRGGAGQLLGEVIATLGLLMVIFLIARPDGAGRRHVHWYIGGAYFFTSSTSFANPAVTIARDVLGLIRRDRARLRARFHHHAAGGDGRGPPAGPLPGG